MYSRRAFLIVIAGFVLFGTVERGELLGAEKAVSHTDCYGDALPPGAVMRLGTTRFRENFRCYAVAYSPDGKLLASAGDGGVVLWEAQSGKRRDFLKSRVNSTGASMGVNSRMFVCSLAFSGDGRYLAAGCDEETVVWELATHKAFHLPCEVERRSATDLVGFTSDNRGVITGDASVVQVREIKTGKVLKRWTKPFLHFALCWPKALSADGKTVVAIDVDGEHSLRVLDVVDGKDRRIEAPQGSLAFSPDKNTLAVLNSTGKITLVDMAAGKAIRSWSIKRSRSGAREYYNTRPEIPPFPEIAFAPDGKSIATKDALWSVATGKELCRLVADSGATYGLCFSPDGKRLAAGKNNRVEFWETATGKKAHDYPNHQGYVKDLAYSPDGRQLVTAGMDDTMRLWDARTGRLIRSFGENGKGVDSVTFLPEGRRLAANHITSVSIWDVADGRLLQKIDAVPLNFVMQVIAVSPSGKTLIVAGCLSHTTNSKSRFIREWDVESGEVLRHYGEGSANISSIAISPDGKVVGVVSDDDTVRLWERATGKLVKALNHPQPNRSPYRHHLAFSPDGSLLAAVCDDGGTIDLGEVAVGRFRSEIVPYPRRQGNSQSSRLYSIAFSPDGKTIITAGCHDSIRLFEVFSGRERIRFKTVTGKVVFSPDGKDVASETLEGGLLIWDITGRCQIGGVGSDPLSINALERLWMDLASTDAALAHRAIWALVAGKKEAVPFLRRKIRAVPRLSAERFKKLIDGLDSDSYQEREQASRELAEQGEAAKPALLVAIAQRRSLEQRLRAQLLVAELPVHFLPVRQLRLMRAIEVYEHSGGGEADMALRVLVEGTVGRAETEQARMALQRLHRQRR